MHVIYWKWDGWEWALNNNDPYFIINLPCNMCCWIIPGTITA